MSGVNASQLYGSRSGHKYRITLLTDGHLWFRIDDSEIAYGCPSEWFIEAIDAGRIFPVADQLCLISSS